MSGDYPPVNPNVGPIPRDHGLSFNTAADVLDYLKSRGESPAQHEHLWVEWDAWRDWGWNPHHHRSRLWVCDVPQCYAVECRAAPRSSNTLPSFGQQIAAKGGRLSPEERAAIERGE